MVKNFNKIASWGFFGMFITLGVIQPSNSMALTWYDKLSTANFFGVIFGHPSYNSHKANSFFRILHGRCHSKI